MITVTEPQAGHLTSIMTHLLPSRSAGAPRFCNRNKPASRTHRSLCRAFLDHTRHTEPVPLLRSRPLQGLVYPVDETTRRELDLL